MFLYLKATVLILRIRVIFFYNNLGFFQAEQVILISGIKMLKISLQVLKSLGSYMRVFTILVFNQLRGF